MKKVTLTIASILISGILVAQDYSPPSNVRTSFTKKHPTAVVDEWIDDDTQFVCYFEDGSDYGSAYFSPKGVWISSEFIINEDDLPANVSSGVKGKYIGFEIIGVTKREDIKQIVYVVSIYNNSTEQDLLITLDPNGKIVKEEDLSDDDSFE
jgi:hypothetical protein|tara:strand:- start:1592 stop:2047 length:456 start_codon:yes stop_codon:yes gene_type:complete